MKNLSSFFYVSIWCFLLFCNQVLAQSEETMATRRVNPELYKTEKPPHEFLKMPVDSLLAKYGQDSVTEILIADFEVYRKAGLVGVITSIGTGLFGGAFYYAFAEKNLAAEASSNRIFATVGIVFISISAVDIILFSTYGYLHKREQLYKTLKQYAESNTLSRKAKRILKANYKDSLL